MNFQRNSSILGRLQRCLGDSQLSVGFSGIPEAFQEVEGDFSYFQRFQGRLRLLKESLKVLLRASLKVFINGFMKKFLQISE